ncbi:hypothetical protein [Streptomyces sp. NRRL F-5755]|uniref:hypothetical protein n=1 Tax=Streptomyces sp. NRRL F-5755 TaxID=1519475 RepID=UPI000AC3E859|nr:hypothetical protein [Streptomyces sp. NRRL F-5755]
MSDTENARHTDHDSGPSSLETYEMCSPPLPLPEARETGHATQEDDWPSDTGPWAHGL